MLEIFDIKPDSDTKAIVRVTGDSLPEVQSTEARRMAIAAATRHIGKCGFDGFGNYTRQNPPATPGGRWVDLTDAELETPGNLRPGNRFVMDIKLNAAI